MDGGAVPLGAAPPSERGLPYWQEATDVVPATVDLAVEPA
jgi:hypothetical protein